MDAAAARTIIELTEGFDTCTTLNYAFDTLYCRLAEAPDQNVKRMLRLKLLRSHFIGRDDGFAAKCVLLENWLRAKDVTVKTRAGAYLDGKIRTYQSPPFTGSSLMAHVGFLYDLEHSRIYGKVEPKPLQKGYLRIHIVTFLDYDGGEPAITKSFDLPRAHSWQAFQYLCSDVTKTIQSKQLGYPYGFQCGLTTGCWYYVKGIIKGCTDYIFDPPVYNILNCDVEYKKLKNLLAEGTHITIIHQWQRAIQLELQKFDNEYLDCKDPGTAPCQPIPNGYIAAISRTYSPYMAVPLSHPVRGLDDQHFLASLPKRGQRSEEGKVAQKARRKANKQKKKAEEKAEKDVAKAAEKEAAKEAAKEEEKEAAKDVVEEQEPNDLEG